MQANPNSAGSAAGQAKQAGHIFSVKSALDAMRAKGEGIEDEVYEAALSQAGNLAR